MSSACGATRNARAELAGRPGGQLRSGAEAPHRVLFGLRRALLHVQGREAGGASTPRTCSRACSGARTCARRGGSSWPSASSKAAISSPAQY